MSTVKDDLILALEHTRDVVHRTYCTHTASGVKVGCWKECTEAAAALDRDRAESEACICGECPACAKDTASACDCWDAGREIGHEAGLEAQREHVGGGTA